MSCSCCGQKGSGSRCCLCNQNSNKFFPWGAKRKICWRCLEKQKLLLKEREKLNEHVKKLLAGKGE